MSAEHPAIPAEELVAGVLAGDRQSFAAVYDQYADRLHDFAYSLLRHREEAADSVADAFVTMAERLEQLRDPELLRPWLYSIVRRECLRRIKARDRQAFEAEERLAVMAESAPGPAESAEQGSLRELLDDAADGLNERDHTLLDLHLRHGLDGAELAEVIGATPEHTYTLMNRLRDQVARALGALLVARQGRRDCPGLDQVLAGWDGRFSPLIRKRVARHVDACVLCEQRRALLVAPASLLSVAPLVVAPLALRDRVLGDSRLVSYWRESESRSGAPATARSGFVRTALSAAVILAVLATVSVALWPKVAGDAVRLSAPGSLQPTTEPATSPASLLASSPQPVPPSSPASPTDEVSVSPDPELVVTPEPTPEPTPESTPAPTTASPPVSPPAPPPNPGALSVSTRSLELGPEADSARIRVTNTGGRAVGFGVDPRADWMTATADPGDIGPGDTRVVVIAVSRDSLLEGGTVGELAITWDGPTIPVEVRVRTARAPVVGRPTLTTSSACSAERFVTVSAPVTDESPLATVRVEWSGDTSGNVVMRRTGQGWTTQIGPLPTLSALVARVIATDVHGAVGTASASYVVEPCPG